MTSTVLPKSMSRHGTWIRRAASTAAGPATVTPLPAGRRVPRQSGQIFLIRDCSAVSRWATSKGAPDIAPHQGGDHALTASTGDHGGQAGQADRPGSRARTVTHARPTVIEAVTGLLR